MGLSSNLIPKILEAYHQNFLSNSLNEASIISKCLGDYLKSSVDQKITEKLDLSLEEWKNFAESIINITNKKDIKKIIIYNYDKLIEQIFDEQNLQYNSI